MCGAESIREGDRVPEDAARAGPARRTRRRRDPSSSCATCTSRFGPPTRSSPDRPRPERPRVALHWPDALQHGYAVYAVSGSSPRRSSPRRRRPAPAGAGCRIGRRRRSADGGARDARQHPKRATVPVRARRRRVRPTASSSCRRSRGATIANTRCATPGERSPRRGAGSCGGGKPASPEA